MFGVAEKWPSKPFMKASDGFENFLKTIVAWAGGSFLNRRRTKGESPTMAMTSYLYYAFGF